MIDLEALLPQDAADAALCGRVWRPHLAGPSLVAIRPEGVFDISAAFPTSSDLAAAPDPASALRRCPGERIGDLATIAANTPPDSRDAGKDWLLAPIDLQAIKATGVTFVVSLLERVIEERARGNPQAAAAIREEVQRLVGDDLSRLKPGSPEAAALKEALVTQGAWSQYIEVGIGPDAELFTKAQPMSAVGTGMDAGIHPGSTWNNPEPEAVIVVAPDGRLVGVTLGNDINLRDFEGRSALLLGRAKDNNASCAVGPFIRFFDDAFTLDDVRRMTVTMTVDGDDGCHVEGESSIGLISRDPADLVAQTIGPNHQYPDGLVLFLGTMFAPVQDREAPGEGFTHRTGDVVRIAAPRLGQLVNRVRPSPQCEPWAFGIRNLMRNLAGRGLLDGKAGSDGQPV